MKKYFVAIAALAAAVTPTIASAQHYGHRSDNYYSSRGYDQRYDRNDRRYYRDHRYDRRDYRNDRRCCDGSTGTVIGAIAGGLLGRTIDRHGDRTAGTVLGAGGGALAGRAIDRNCR